MNYNAFFVPEKSPPSSPLRHFRFSRKTFHEEIRQLRFPTKNIFIFPEGRNLGLGPKSAAFSYTCPNFQLFLGKSPAFLTILGNRLLSRTRV